MLLFFVISKSKISSKYYPHIWSIASNLHFTQIMRSPHIKNAFMFFYWLAMVSFFIYIACHFWRLLIWEMCINFWLKRKMGQLLFILGSTLDLRSQEIRQKRLKNVMCSSNVSKNQPISPHHVLLQKSSATTPMSFIWQIFNLDMWMCSLRENQLIPKLMMFRPYSSTQPLMFMIIHRLFNVIHWTLQN